MKVLIIEDEPGIATRLAQMLPDATISVVDNVHDAWGKLYGRGVDFKAIGIEGVIDPREPYDQIFLDLKIPTGATDVHGNVIMSDPYYTIQRLAPQIGNTPCVVLSGLDCDQDLLDEIKKWNMVFLSKDGMFDTGYIFKFRQAIKESNGMRAINAVAEMGRAAFRQTFDDTHKLEIVREDGEKKLEVKTIMPMDRAKSASFMMAVGFLGVIAVVMVAKSEHVDERMLWFVLGCLGCSTAAAPFVIDYFKKKFNM